jgi:hypothetical protein
MKNSWKKQKPDQKITAAWKEKKSGNPDLFEGAN